MKNPVRSFRQDVGLKRLEFALAIGLSYRQLWEIEIGYVINLPQSLVRVLIEQGYSGDPAEDYKKWREEVGKSVWEAKRN